MLEGMLSVSCFLYAHLTPYKKLSQILISVAALQIKISYLKNHEAFLEKVTPVPVFTVNWYQAKENFLRALIFRLPPKRVKSSSEGENY